MKAVSFLIKKDGGVSVLSIGNPSDLTRDARKKITSGSLSADVEGIEVWSRGRGLIQRVTKSKIAAQNAHNKAVATGTYFDNSEAEEKKTPKKQSQGQKQGHKKG